jgi:hypothetical protein
MGWYAFQSQRPKDTSGGWMAGRSQQMTMEQAISILTRSGWSIDMDEKNKRIVLHAPLPEVNWLHLLRPKYDRENGQDDGYQG